MPWNKLYRIKMKLKLIVFDMAGTTVCDFDNVNEALQNALEKKEIIVSRDEVNTVMGFPKPIAIERLMYEKIPEKSITKSLIDEVHEEFENFMIDFYANSPIVKEKQGASELFEILKSHDIKVALDTGFNRKIADTIIHRLGWREKNLIDFSVTSDEVSQGRPYPDMIYSAMKHFGIQSMEQVAKVGDTSSDMIQGDAAGCRFVIGVVTGAYSAQQLLLTPHTHLIKELSEIPAVIGLTG
jgi:phosphonatase-like hydrolase